MKTRILALSLLVFSVAGVRAQSMDILGFYGDWQGADCTVLDQTPGLIVVYVFHQTSGATSVLFNATPPACWTAILVGVVPVGDCGSRCSVPDALELLYGECLSGTVHVADLNFFGLGTTGPCCAYLPLPAAEVPSGRIEVVDCDGNIRYAIASPAIANPDASCPCEPTIPVEETTWGRVKALYSQAE